MQAPGHSQRADEDTYTHTHNTLAFGLCVWTSQPTKLETNLGDCGDDDDDDSPETRRKLDKMVMRASCPRASWRADLVLL